MRKTKAEAMKTREYLMMAALNTFYDKGVSRSSLNEIAQTAGVTRGALYWHFKNKENLFEALFQHIFADISQRLNQDIESNTPDIWENFRCVLMNCFERLEHNETHHKFCAILHLKCEHTEKNEAIVKVMHNYQEMYRQQIKRVLEACVKQGKLPADLDIDIAAAFVQAQLFGLSKLWLSNTSSLNLSEIAPRFVETMLGALQFCSSLRKIA